MHLRRSSLSVFCLCTLLLGILLLVSSLVSFYVGYYPSDISHHWRDWSHKLSPEPSSTPALALPPTLGLPDRLRALLAAPVLSSAEAHEQNVELCPLDVHDRQVRHFLRYVISAHSYHTVANQVNPDQLANDREKWTLVNDTEILIRRRAMVDYLEDFERRGVQVVGGANTGQGIGIVMTGGNQVSSSRVCLQRTFY